jgi:Spy/CpxP family protein refolding chaperone
MSESLFIVDSCTPKIKLTEEQKKENHKKAMTNYYNKNKEKLISYQKRLYDNLEGDKKHKRLENANQNMKKRVNNMDENQYKEYILYISDYNRKHPEQRKKTSAKYWVNYQAKKKSEVIQENILI